MPSIQIDIQIFEPGQGYAKTNFRRSFIIHDKPMKDKVSNEDFKKICNNLKFLLTDYNNGEREKSWNWNPQ